MNPSTEQLIRDIATQLGTTSNHLWEVMVRQAPIQSITNLLIQIAWFFLAIFLVWISRYLEDDEMPWQILARALGSALALIMIIVIGVEASWLPAALFNPEYYALHDLFQHLK